MTEFINFIRHRSDRIWLNDVHNLFNINRGINQDGYREVFINAPNTYKHSSNSIRRTKYTILTFLPLFIFDQFRNYTNFFFLLVSLVQQLPDARFLGQYTTLAPLIIILCFSAIKELFEDIKRYRADHEINNKICEVFRDDKWWGRKWKQIELGDIVKVNENEFFPADLLIISSSDKDTNACYIDTANLDGETNLKLRHCVKDIKVDPLNQFKGVVECDTPNEFIYDFKGLVKLENSSIVVPVDSSNLLLRGSNLKNTEWVWGLVVYTGCETKIMKNTSTTRLKRSTMSVIINKQISLLFVLFICLIIIELLLSIWWNNENYARIWYMDLDKITWGSPQIIVTVIILGVIYSIIIPISLPVMLETARIMQGMFIAWDNDMKGNDGEKAVVRSSSLNEDLGLIKYIFADKTGTLTQNKLEFIMCSVDKKIIYLDDLGNANLSSDNISRFFLSIVLNPGIIPIQRNDDITYFTSSPDQLALLRAAQQFGMILLKRTDKQAVVSDRGRHYKYTIECNFDFTSDRKRSSVVIRDQNSQLLLLVMGADDTILPLCNPSEIVTSVDQHLEQFSKQGLRSICIAMRYLDEEYFHSWYPSYSLAKKSLHNKEAMLNEAESAITDRLTLLGCTAVEDMLQIDVRDTIQSLLKAGINIWMLTGDKLETAINISYSCGLLYDDHELIILNLEKENDLKEIILRYKEVIGQKFGKPGVTYPYGLIVTGASMKILFASEDICLLFITLMLCCQVVVCCRTTPKQKAEIVSKVQKHTKYVTLAIGDGANDVAMIQTANVGIGITGMEGRQAANSADYAIGEFRHLKKLLLVHGSWSYDRNSKMVWMIYYKNLTLALWQFMDISGTGWSGQMKVDKWARMLYNVILTSMPTMILGVVEQFQTSDILMNQPELYKTNGWFGYWSLFVAILNAALHSGLLFYISIKVFSVDVFWKSGNCDAYLISGHVIYTTLILIVTMKNFIVSNFWTTVMLLSMLLSIVCWLVMLYALSYVYPRLSIGEDMPGVFGVIIETPLFYLFILFTTVTILLLDIACIVYLKTIRARFTKEITNTN